MLSKAASFHKWELTVLDPREPVGTSYDQRANIRYLNSQKINKEKIDDQETCNADKSVSFYNKLQILALVPLQNMWSKVQLAGLGSNDR